MTAPQTENQVQPQSEVKKDNKEYNFRNLEAKYEKQLAQERAEKERLIQQLLEKQKTVEEHDEDDSSEPYIDKNRLTKTLNKFGQTTATEIQKAMEIAKKQAKEELKQEMWLKSNSDFYDVMQNVDKFAAHDPELAETILAMPEGFERQKLVYKNIKALGLHEEPKKESTIQQKIDANRKSPYYQPSGVGTSPYGMTGDFTRSGQEQAYKKMKEMQARLRGG